ncbi:nucleotidyltransferase family protein [Salinibius halmophilus]|uniref:nucleotidyltransferase family protein n=1 Tax=Salinibius halmophilus TaxID=1853216 RepID=UPI000E66706A|nr:nucleotidyltransferase domain-containing protein [Salinibius halmophilus]
MSKLSNATHQYLAAITTILKQHGIQQCCLFGSRTLGTERPGSDIDLCIMDDIDIVTLNAIDIDLEDLLLPVKVDLTKWSSIDNPDLKDHINRVGYALNL